MTKEKGERGHVLEGDEDFSPDTADEEEIDSQSTADGVTDVEELRAIVRRVELELSSERELSLKYAEQTGEWSTKFRLSEKNLSIAYRFWIPAAFLVGVVLATVLIAK